MNTAVKPDPSSNAADKAAGGATQRQILLNDNRMDSHDLFTGNREITIAHGDDVYRLRLTAQNKLILTK